MDLIRGNKSLLLITSLALIVVITAVVYYFFQGNSLTQKNIYTFTNELIEHDIGINDPEQLIRFLTANNIVDGQNTTHLSIRIVASIDEPMFFQTSAKDGNTIVASKVIDLGEGKKEILIAPYELVFSTKSNPGKWIDSKFIDAAAYLAKRNENALSSRDFEPVQFFYINNKNEN